MQVDAGAEDKEEEVATEDPAVEQEEEHDDESVWEVNDSSSPTPSGHHATEGEAHSQSAESPWSAASTRYQANEQQDTSPTGEAVDSKGPATTPANPSELPRHRNSPWTVALWRKATAQAVVLQMSKKWQFHRENKSSKALDGGGNKRHWPVPQPPQRELNPRRQMTALRINGSCRGMERDREGCCRQTQHSQIQGCQATCSAPEHCREHRKHTRTRCTRRWPSKHALRAHWPGQLGRNPHAHGY